MPESSPPPVARDGFERLPLERLKGAGPRVIERLAKLGIERVQDLLWHLPLRYQDRSELRPIAGIQADDEVLIEGEVRDLSVSGGGRRSLRVWLCDDSGCILLRFFHFSQYHLDALRPGARLRCFGEARQGPDALELVHPEYRSVADAAAIGLVPGLTPVYPSTAGLHQPQWRNLIGQALTLLDAVPLPECLPSAWLERLELPTLPQALSLLHQPPPGIAVDTLIERQHPAARRLIFEELVAHQASLRRARAGAAGMRGPLLAGTGQLRARFRHGLPFRLTAAQERVVDEIARDLAGERPMQRLLQGDVGSGKTVVAALAALQAVESGYQAALMAPTELLSEQHWRNLRGWLEPLDISLLWLAGRHQGRERRAALAALVDGTAQVAIGTHALVQDAVGFARLGLVIIDEQHRFGVHQRMRLLDKGRASTDTAPHQLIMTATPIPRSLAMTLYADLDLSVIDRLPPGRTPVTTVAISDQRRDEVIARVRAACAQGRQAYWVCTLIEESEVLQCQAAEDTARELGAALDGLRVGLVHGRLKVAERTQTMQAFGAGELDLLVATTVIEVGVDVPNASLMIIENPERLGLAQLHQLRGRVGRGAVESHCVLLYHAPLSATAHERIAILRTHRSGFAIAERDLAMRGAGEVLGTRQTGSIQFRVADPVRDQDWIALAQKVADELLRDQPRLAQCLIARWLGDQQGYAHV